MFWPNSTSFALHLPGSSGPIDYCLAVKWAGVCSETGAIHPAELVVGLTCAAVTYCSSIPRCGEGAQAPCDTSRSSRHTADSRAVQSLPPQPTTLTPTDPAIRSPTWRGTHVALLHGRESRSYYWNIRVLYSRCYLLCFNEDLACPNSGNPT